MQTQAPPRPGRFVSMVLSGASLGFTLAAWAAGSHKYGAISRAWQLIPVPGLILAGLCLLCVAALSIRRGIQQTGLSRYWLPTGTLLVCAAPLLYLLAIIAFRVVYRID